MDPETGTKGPKYSTGRVSSRVPPEGLICACPEQALTMKRAEVAVLTHNDK